MYIQMVGLPYSLSVYTADAGISSQKPQAVLADAGCREAHPVRARVGGGHHVQLVRAKRGLRILVSK